MKGEIMSILNIFNKKPNAVSKETNVAFPILPCSEPSTLEKNKTEKEESIE